ncbi:MAG: DegT/DnrJ/EryC1/StrS family aminotransferase [Verrucomicrobiota bacterium]
MVPLLDLKRTHASIQSDLETAAQRVLRSGGYVLGPEADALEVELAAYTETPHAVACASGSDALLLALMTLGIGPGDAVITTPYTFFSTVSNLTRLGIEVRFADIDPGTYNLDAAKLTPELAAGAKVVMPVHLFGQMADMDAVAAYAEEHGLQLIEDAAQSLGAKWNGRPAGSWSAIAATSFYPTKNLGGFGDGGACLCSKEDWAARMKVLRNHGMEPKYHHPFVGVNSRLDAIQAALLRVKLPHLDAYAEARRGTARRYRERFAEAGLALEAGAFSETAQGIVLPVELPLAEHVYNQFTIRAPRRDALMAHLKEHGIGCEIYYPIPLHLQECFDFLGYKEGDFPVAESAAKTSLALPSFGELTDAEIDEVVGAVASFYA